MFGFGKKKKIEENKETIDLEKEAAKCLRV